MRKLIFVILTYINFTVFVGVGYGQEVQISGIVEDDKGLPLGGNNVSVTYQKHKRVPNAANGKFVIVIEGNFDKSLLKVKKKGYAIKEIIIIKSPSSELKVVMWESDECMGLLKNDNEQPLADAWVVFREGEYEEKSKTDKAGKFSFFVPKNVSLTNSSYFEANGEKIMPENIGIEKREGMNLVTLTFGKAKPKEIEQKIKNTNINTPKGEEAVFDERKKTQKKDDITPENNSVPAKNKDKMSNGAILEKIVLQIQAERTYISAQNQEIKMLIEQFIQPLKDNSLIDKNQKQEIQENLSIIRSNLIENEQAVENMQEKNRLLINHLTLLTTQKDSLENMALLAIKKLDSANVEREKMELSNQFAIQENQKMKMFFGLVAVFLILLSLVFFLFGKRERKKNEELEQKNHEIEQQSTAIQNISHELRQMNTELQNHQEKLKMTNEVLENQNQEISNQNSIIQAQNLRTETFAQQLEREVEKKTYELRAMLDKTTKQNEDLQQFSYIISHNIRSPIAHLLGLVNIFNRENFSDPFNMEVLSHLDTAAQNLDTVVRDLAQIISIRNRLNRTKEKVSIADIIFMEKEMLANDLENSKAIFAVDIAEDCEIFSVKSYLQSIVHNLLSNAIKYKARSRQLEIKIKVYVVDKFLCLSIKDNGIGMEINSATQQRLFGLYQRMHDHVEGKGLGLYMVKTQVEALNGKIEVESTLDEGTTFTVYFPKNV